MTPSLVMFVNELFVIVASEPEMLKALRQLVTILLSISIHVDERTSVQVAFEPDIVEFWSAI